MPSPMVAIADSRHQPELLDEAKRAGKIAPDYEIPAEHRANLPEALKRWLGPHDLPAFAFGTDFDETERRLLPALSRLGRARRKRLELIRLVRAGLRGDPAEGENACLRRMDLHEPRTLSERLTAAALRGALRAGGLRPGLPGACRGWIGGLCTSAGVEGRRVA